MKLRNVVLAAVAIAASRLNAITVAERIVIALPLVLNAVFSFWMARQSLERRAARVHSPICSFAVNSSVRGSHQSFGATHDRLTV